MNKQNVLVVSAERRRSTVKPRPHFQLSVKNRSTSKLKPLFPTSTAETVSNKTNTQFPYQRQKQSHFSKLADSPITSSVPSRRYGYPQLIESTQIIDTIVVKGSIAKNDNSMTTVATSSATYFKDMATLLTESVTNDCVHDLTKPSGDIIFPNPFLMYKSNLDNFTLSVCRWRIRVPMGPNVKIRFNSLSLNLEKEYLQLSVGMGGATKMRRITGTKIPRDIIFNGTEIWLTLKYDHVNSNAQIAIMFTETSEEATFPRQENSTCGGEVKKLQGNLISPGYPFSNYSNSEVCSWTINAPANSVIKIVIKSLYTEIYDQVTIGIGLLPDVQSSKVLTLFGHLEEEKETIIPSNSMWINFQSDDSVSAKGFLIYFEVILQEICRFNNEVFTSEHGTITSVNYPNPYPINSECSWRILAPPMSKIQLIVHDFLVQDDRDFLLVGKGEDVFEGPFETYSGNLTKALNVTLDSDKVWLHFTSKQLEEETVYSGFNLSYTVILPDIFGSLVIEQGVVTEPPIITTFVSQDQPLSDDLSELSKDQNGGRAGSESSNLPEWLIGVIVVVILLIIVFFAMVIYSLVKERKKSRAGSYGAATSVSSPEEPKDVNKTDGCIRITSFITDSETNKENTNGWVDTEAATLQRRPQGRSNPVFNDNEELKKKGDKKKSEKSNDKKHKELKEKNTDKDSNASAADRTEAASNNVTKPDDDTKINVSAEVNTIGQPEDTSLTLTDEQVLTVMENSSENTGGNKDLSTNL
ncbi:hypothetical protein LOTGIDRAFT_227965 [Lottia gigantea]|uniref:CUB domain-containing protein n=1 Tax=Lottia gigantea TaxID=225164 RepID=V4BHL2_LOTGI|nr:hypothetical protein LOTGIDRAFT_227965 [Lottia gigantea]ESP05332.1 hypothetical protein LOTGIDRAFT_227965 [Lottia gigantea]